MHIPDGFLATPVWATLDLAALPVMGYCVRRTQARFDESRAPLLGVMGAFVFAAQMINFPVGVGTSGHLVGGALLALTLGPWAASVVMTAILVVQALVFQDGGITALGANVLNMAVAGVWLGYLPVKLAGGPKRVAVFLGGWLSLVGAALLATVQLSLSQVAPNGPLFASMLGIHALTGLAEGAITVAAFGAIARLSPKFVFGFTTPAPGPNHAIAVPPVAAPAASLEAGDGFEPARRGVVKRLVWAVGGTTLLLALVGAIVASTAPDGLERVAERLGFASRGAATVTGSPFADYQARFVHSPWLAPAAAGLLGVMLLYGFGVLFRRALQRRK